MSALSWTNLAYQPYFSVTAANVLFPSWSHDIEGDWADQEMYTRWLQVCLSGFRGLFGADGDVPRGFGPSSRRSLQSLEGSPSPFAPFVSLESLQIETGPRRSLSACSEVLQEGTSLSATASSGAETSWV